MKDRQFFENLDTSFIRLEALVRYMSRRNFIGSIYVKFTGYVGEITFTPEKKLRVTEKDQIAGRVISGEKAFNSIVSRSAASGGIINVVQSLNVLPRVVAHAAEDAGDGKAADAANGNGNSNGISKIVQHVRIEPKSPDAVRARGSLSQRPDFPFDLANHFEMHETDAAEPGVDLELMTDVTSDLLSTIDHALRHAGLDFSAALQKACADVSNKHPFLDPQKRLFKYSQGFVFISPKNELNTFATGVGDTLARIFDRLNSSPKYGKVHRYTVQKVRQLLHTRRVEFEKAGLMPHVDRALTG